LAGSIIFHRTDNLWDLSAGKDVWGLNSMVKMKTIEITDDAYELLEEKMGGAGLDNFSEAIIGQDAFIQTLMNSRTKLIGKVALLYNLLYQLKKHGYDWHYEECEFDYDNEETCTCSWKSLAAAIRECDQKTADDDARLHWIEKKGNTP
jgi:hypothetical protein